ncbi:unnamed protein product [Heterotrigona itama]|uniref:Secreted protein n=1 Tax=Heterotrigona itama TaxID=395501 RepID=A0A6V7HIS4_9HYME|nr:unnamed protein product [Heterotrigona itama]
MLTFFFLYFVPAVKSTWLCLKSYSRVHVYKKDHIEEQYRFIIGYSRKLIKCTEFQKNILVIRNLS